MDISSIFKINKIDHYAVIVKDIENSQNFHINFLGFSFVKSYSLTTSEYSNTEDTLSVVLEKNSASSKEICVLNKPLNSLSFLNKYIERYGEGIHHIAYEVDNIEQEFKTGLSHNIAFTSENIILDPINKLKQVFIDRKYTGYFIELIERSNSVEQNGDLFSQTSIKELILSTS